MRDTPTDPDDGSTRTRSNGRRSLATRSGSLDFFPSPSSDWWLAVGLLAGVVVALAYLATHRYPAYGAGLYLEIAQQIRLADYALPSRIPDYTGGLPFAYPPLAFYGLAALLDLGLGPFAISRFVPAILTVTYLVPYYGIAAELLATRRQAGVATVLLATCPPVLQWHLSAGGVVRGTAFLFALAGIYAGVRLFRRRERWWAVVGTLLFAATVLTHPVYTVFFGMSWLLLYAVYDRTLVGFGLGASVSGGGLLVASPWWIQVVRTHGVGVFTAAAGTHSGLGGGVHRVLDQFVYPIDPTVVTLFYLASFGAGVVLLSRRRYVLPLWLVAGAFLLGKERFQFVAGAMMVAVVLFEVVLPRLERLSREGMLPLVSRGDSRGLRTAVVALTLVVAAVTGGLYAGSVLQSAHHDSPSQPPFVDDADVAATQWAAAETDPDATFVVLGDAAEWFPYLSDREIAIGPWGVEWTEPAGYERQLTAYRAVSTCSDATCVSTTLSSMAVSPDYLVVPKGSYTVRGLEHRSTGELRASLAASDSYRQTYENSGVVVFRVDR